MLQVTIYFADVISDIQVLILLNNTGNHAWAAMGSTLLVAQFVVVYIRVMPYMHATFGGTWFYYVFLYFGFPTGILMLDCLMFLEPFGLLAVLPLPEWMRTFIPSYKSTRIIAEVLIESMPQTLLQSYIYVIVLRHAAAGTASDAELRMLEFSAALPKSIVISTIAILKTWLELVHGAREAGLTVRDRGVQLWQLGAGLPLDALKKGTISEFVCPYLLQQSEISPLLDALEKNSSLVHLDLTASGITWNTASATGTPLVEAMATKPAVLAGLETLVVCPSSKFAIPVGKLRAEKGALEALRAQPLFSTGREGGTPGPRRMDLNFMAAVRHQNTSVGVINAAEAETAKTITKLLMSAKKGKVKRDAWEKQLTQLMLNGLRRSQLHILIRAETLRDVGFKVRLPGPTRHGAQHPVRPVRSGPLKLLPDVRRRCSSSSRPISRCASCAWAITLAPRSARLASRRPTRGTPSLPPSSCGRAATPQRSSRPRNTR